MYPHISAPYSEILNVFSEDKPDFLLPFFESKTLQRLGGISQTCGTGFTKFYKYQFNQSRLDHSVGVALIIWNFTGDKKQTLSWLFHDISHSVFSHVGDFILGDAINQESSEQYITKLISEDPVIVEELKKLHLCISDVDDYAKYSIADNPGPKLSADRLEYTLSTSIVLQTRTIHDIRRIYNDIVVVTDEGWEKEMCFQNRDIAEDFWKLSIENDAGCFSSYESVSAMSFLSEILKLMLQKGLISPINLYTLNDLDIIKIIQEGKSEQVKDMWDFFMNLSQYKIYRYKPKNTGKYLVSSLAKRRYIDPLVLISGNPKRLSGISKEFNALKDYHVNRKEEWIELSYAVRN